MQKKTNTSIALGKSYQHNVGKIHNTLKINDICILPFIFNVDNRSKTL